MPSDRHSQLIQQAADPIDRHGPVLVATIFSMGAIWADGRWYMVAVGILFLVTAVERSFLKSSRGDSSE